MKIIDTHVHFWDLRNQINSWVMKQPDKNLQKNYLPEDIANICDNELLGIVHIEAHDSTVPTINEITWLKEKMDNLNLQYKHIAFADITQSNQDFIKSIDQIKSFKNVVGIRHILSHSTKFSYNPNNVDSSDNENIKNNLKYLAQNDLIFNCQVYSAQMANILPAIIDSNVITVIDHLLLPAWNSYNDVDYKLWQEAVLNISQYNNIYLKISGLDMFKKNNDFDLVIKHCLDSFPIDHLIYGSNYPVSFNNNYNNWQNYLDQLNLSTIEKEHIFYKTAVKIFKFNLK